MVADYRIYPRYVQGDVMYLAPTAVYEVGGRIIDETGADRVINRTFFTHAVQGDATLIAAQGPGVKIRIVGLSISSARFFQAGAFFKSDTNQISHLFFLGGGVVTSIIYPFSAHGWFQTNANEALIWNVDNVPAAETSTIHLLWVQAT